MDWISDDDWARFAAASADPSAEPRYEVFRGWLTWPDEHVPGLSEDGKALLGDLFVARALLHSGRSITAWPGGSDRLQQVWDQARAADLPWPGFARVQLSAAHDALLRREAERSLFAEV